MSNKNKAIIWTLLSILFASLLFVVGTYAYFSTKEIYDGTFQIDVTSKGVDTLRFEKSDASFVANSSNFAIYDGHDVSGEATFNVVLDTTNKSATYCYETKVTLPDEPVFRYSKEGVPELVLNIIKSSDGVNYESVISNMDITTGTGVIRVPIKSGSSNYKNSITANKNVTQTDYWKAKITLKWLEDVYQEQNDFKSYKAVFEANVVEC